MEIRDDDLAAVLVELEQRLPREEIASALGIDERELAEIASGYLPEQEVAERLRALARGGDHRGEQAPPRISPRLVVAFVVVDLVFFAGVALFVLSR